MINQKGIKMGYYIDLAKISLVEYREILRTADLLPSREILKEDIDRRFALLKTAGMETVEDLYQRLRTKKRFDDFIAESSLSRDYLMILIREVKSLHPKPIKLAEFPETPPDFVKKLSASGITNTETLYDRVLTPDDRTALAKQTGLPETEIQRLARLTDLCRIRWVNHTFAYVLLEAGFSSTAEVAQADPKTLHARVEALNQKQGIYNAHIGLHDIILCVNAAKDLCQEMRF
jgi:hypothetical protein